MEVAITPTYVPSLGLISVAILLGNADEVHCVFYTVLCTQACYKHTHAHARTQHAPIYGKNVVCPTVL